MIVSPKDARSRIKRNMRLIIYLTLFILLMMPLAAFASDISGALYWAGIQITNNSTATTNVATTATINTTNLINAGYLNSGANNSVMRNTSGSDVLFMPGYTPDGYPWVMLVPSIGEDSMLSYILYTANSSGGEIRYFPGSEGMTTSDSAPLEPGDNFTITLDGYIDTTVPGANITAKEDAIRFAVGSPSGNITATIFGQGDPVVAANNTSATNGTNHTVALPTGISAGDLLIVFFAADGTPVITFPGDWTFLFDDAPGASPTFAAYYRIADGGEGASITVTTNVAEGTAHTSYRITNYSGVPEVGAHNWDTSTTPDPPNLTPSWGALNTLWIACFGANALETISAYPASYVGGIYSAGLDANAAIVGTAQRSLNAASENPGTFTKSGNQMWAANTVAIRPGDYNITATGISSGLIKLELIGDSSNITIEVDDVVQNSLAFNGSVPDNANDWKTATAAACKYMERYRVWVGGVLQQDIQWEYAATFTDASGNGHDATPTFRTASSDPDVSANMSSFRPIAEAKAPAFVLATAPDFIDPGITGNVTGTFTTTPASGAFPLSGLITTVANATGTPPQIPLLIIAAFVILVFSLSFSYVTRKFGAGSIMLKILVVASVMGIFVALGDFGIEFWMIVVFLMIAPAFALASKQGSW